MPVKALTQKTIKSMSNAIVIHCELVFHNGVDRCMQHCIRQFGPRPCVLL